MSSAYMTMSITLLLGQPKAAYRGIRIHAVDARANVQAAADSRKPVSNILGRSSLCGVEDGERAVVVCLAVVFGDRGSRRR